MIDRPFWRERIETAWGQTPIVWLSGVRRCGKTTLAKALGEDRTLFVNCDLPAVEDMVANPGLFYRNCDRPIIVFDEVHQLRDPSRLLKIGADLFPHLKILATGSSTLAATRKFKDTLTGRKRTVHLTPILWDELEAFQVPLAKRLYQGGLPEALLAVRKEPSFYREWMDSFFARDIQKLFAFRDFQKFNALFEYVMKQSGGLLETTRAANALGVSRATVENHLRAMEITHAVTLLRPFHGGGQKELVKTPKGYAFDTGFVGFNRGWDPLRPNDYGILWEHLVLEHLQAHRFEENIHYWRDAAGREVDFIIVRDRKKVDALECKWEPSQFDPTALKLFRTYYPDGDNYLLSPLNVPGYSKKMGTLEMYVCSPKDMLKRAIRKKGKS